MTDQKQDSGSALKDFFNALGEIVATAPGAIAEAKQNMGPLLGGGTDTEKPPPRLPVEIKILFVRDDEDGSWVPIVSPITGEAPPELKPGELLGSYRLDKEIEPAPKE